MRTSSLLAKLLNKSREALRQSRLLGASRRRGQPTAPAGDATPAHERGWVEGASFTRVWGWANGPVSVRVNGVAAATVAPAGKRADLPDDGRLFEAPIDPLGLVEGENNIEVRFAGSGTLVGDGAQKVNLSVAPSFISGFSQASAARGLWTVGQARVSDDRLLLRGWCVAPRDAASPGALFCDGETLRFESKPDRVLQAQTWLPADMPVRRYEAEFRFRAPLLEVSFGEDGRPFNPDHTFLIPRALSAQPGDAGVARVAGGREPLKFDMNGVTVARRLRHAFAQHGRLPLAEASVLDWGVGAGRVARFLAPNVGRFHGADIDADNLAWCREHLPSGAFVQIEPDPPTSLPSGQFDFIYGISVLTHLTRDYERAWLAELRRLVKDDGVVALSIHGPTALAVIGLCHEHARLAKDGFLDFGANSDLRGVAPESYYRNVTQSLEHIRRVWGEFFSVEEIATGAVGNFQDLVVLRPRAKQA